MSDPESLDSNRDKASDAASDHVHRDKEPGSESRRADPERAVVRARTAQKSFVDLGVRERIRLLARIKRAFLARADEITKLASEERGRPFEETLWQEILPCSEVFEYWLGSIEELLTERPIELHGLLQRGRAARAYRVPRGVIALITPAADPVAIPVRAMVPALLSGNVVVLKASDGAARSAKWLVELFNSVLPANVLQVLEGDGRAGEALIASGVDGVMLVGTVATGKRVSALCAENMVPASLQLGSKGSAVVLADAPIERAARAVVASALNDGGAGCASIDRVYVEDSVAQAFAERVVEVVKSLDSKRDVSAPRRGKQSETANTRIAQAVARGAEILIDNPCAVLRVSDEGCDLLTRETLAPVLSIVSVTSAKEAQSKVNAGAALSVSLWTDDLERGRSIADGLRAPVVTINDASSASIAEAPWASAPGFGSGISGGPHALDFLTRPRVVIENESRAAVFSHPYTPSLRRTGLLVAKARGGSGIVGTIMAALALLIAWPLRLFGK